MHDELIELTLLNCIDILMYDQAITQQVRATETYSTIPELTNLVLRALPEGAFSLKVPCEV